MKFTEESQLPQADGYLVQGDFKNGFKDFRISDCFFARTPEEIVDTIRDLSDNNSGYGINVTSYWPAKDEEERSRILKAFEPLEDEGYFISPKGWMDQVVVYGPYQVKVWPLVGGRVLSKGISGIVSPNGDTYFGNRAAAKGKEDLDAHCRQLLEDEGIR